MKRNVDFINREQELAFLRERWREPKAQLIIIWGKRRVGKTELVKQFIKDKPHVYFLAESTSEQEQLIRFSHSVAKIFKEPLLETRGFASWEESFRYLKEKNKRFVLVVDEFPYLILSNPSIPSLFQKGWDEYLSGSNIYCVLLGSSMAMMESEVLGYRAPLYGRRTGQWRIDPMTFDAASGFRKEKSFEDKLNHFAVAGGVPAYWLQFDRNKDLWRNLKDCVLRKGQPLYDEVEFILREELREPRYYFALLQAISQGKRKLSEIVNATGINQPVANKYLSVLADLKIIERELPVTEEKPLKSKKGLYRIIDRFFQFWFRFIFPRRGELELGRIDDVLGSIRLDWKPYLSSVYEQVATETMLKHMDRFFPFIKIGRWWSKDEEIDFVALNRELNSILFGEAKWSERLVGTDIYENLKRKAEQVEMGGIKGRKELYCLFSKKGFTEAMIKKAKEEGVILFKQDMMIGI
jgi:AAA+ ATPase superfamily predicted ATPase